MAEIIHPNFNESEDDLPRDDLETVTGLIGLLIETPISERMDKFISSMKRLKELRVFLQGLGAVSSNETMALRQDLVSDMSFEQMCDVLINSYESQWQLKPSYYQALSNRFSPESLEHMLGPNRGPR